MHPSTPLLDPHRIGLPADRMTPVASMPPRVLVIDGDSATLELYQEVFEEDGMVVHVANDTLPLDTIRQLRPDLILLECQLARADDGCLLLQRVRQDPDLGRIPCVVCTGARNQAQAMADELTEWDVAVIDKPFDLNDLISVVHANLARSPLEPVPVEEQTPHTLARLYNHYLSALWRGDDISAVTRWLEAHWNGQGPPEPTGHPDAVSLSSKFGIRWYQAQAAVLGYPPGPTRGCYQIPITEALPAAPGLKHSGYDLRS